MVTAIEDNPHLLACARRKVERAGWKNVRLLASLDPAQIPHADGIIIGYNPPIVLQRPDLLEAAWVMLRPGVVFPPWERAARHRPDGWPALWSGSGSSCSAIPAIGITGPCTSPGSILRSFPAAHVGRIQAGLRVHSLRHKGPARQRACGARPAAAQLILSMP